MSAAKKIAAGFIRNYPEEAIEAFEKFSPEARSELFEQLDPMEQQQLLKFSNPQAIADFIASFPGLKELSERADPSLLARIIGRLSAEDKASSYEVIPEMIQSEIEAILSFPEGTAGSLMELRVHFFHLTDTVRTALDQLRSASSRNVTSVFAVDFSGVLQGRVYLQDLVSASDETLLQSIMVKTPAVSEMTPMEDVVQLAEDSKVPSMPVVDTNQNLIGVIRNERLMSMVHQNASDDLQTMVGVSKDEKATSPAFFAVQKRLPWLSVNLLTTFLAAFVVGMFEDTIAKITALAVLLPVVAGQSGNTGAQAQAVTMRGLALREIRLRHKWQVLMKETSVGLFNGIAIGALCAVSVYFWSSSLPLAGVIGVAMVLAMVAASFSGAAVPMILTAIGQDPATSSSIILTTITDIVGFLSFLGLATIFGSYLI